MSTEGTRVTTGTANEAIELRGIVSESQHRLCWVLSLGDINIRSVRMRDKRRVNQNKSQCFDFREELRQKSISIHLPIDSNEGLNDMRLRVGDIKGFGDKQINRWEDKHKLLSSYGINNETHYQTLRHYYPLLPNNRLHWQSLTAIGSETLS